MLLADSCIIVLFYRNVQRGNVVQKATEIGMNGDAIIIYFKFVKPTEKNNSSNH